MDATVQVLDHGFITLKAVNGDESDIVRAARVSHAANEKTGQDPEADEKLIKYLYKHGHTSPFEHCSVTFHVKAPIFVFRQWHRHRTWSYNEVSARYTELPDEYYIPTIDQITTQSKSNHQSRTKTIVSNASMIQGLMQAANHRTYSLYKDLLASGVARELARSVLPVAMYSEMYATANLWNVLRFLKLRLDSHAQYEIRVYAESMAWLLQEHFPITMDAFAGEST